MKTVRFTEIVERSGRPHVHTLWVAPEKDPALARARKTHRVMTIEQGRGKTDTARVGYDPDRDQTSQILIFPKSLRAFEGARVVGIKFDLIEQPKLVTATPSRTRRAPPKGSAGKHKAAKPRPAAADHERRTETAAGDVADPARGTSPAKRMTQRQRPPVKVVELPRRAAKSKKHSPLAREILAALKELEAGNNVAAYRRLQRAVEEEE